MLCLLPELVHKGTKDDQRDYLFYLGVANYKLKVVIRAFPMFSVENSYWNDLATLILMFYFNSRNMRGL